MSTGTLQKELAVYEANLTKWLDASQQGKFVLIKGDVIEGPFDTYEEALRVGYTKHAPPPFLVKQLSLPVIEPRGPIIQIAVGASKAHADILTSLGEPVPRPFLLNALIDTGASCSCIDPAVVKELGWQPTGVAHILSPSTDSKPVICLQYDVSIQLVHPTMNRMFHNIQVAECELKEFGFHALIGRDILRACILIYNGEIGAAGAFTLSF